MQLSDTITNLQETKRTEKHVKGYHGEAISKIQTVVDSLGQTIQFLQQINCRYRDLEPID